MIYTNTRPAEHSGIRTAYSAHITGVKKRVFTADQIISAVCRYFDIEKWKLLGGSRFRRISDARFIAMYLMRKKTSMSLKNIGEELGSRHHTTVMHALLFIEDQLSMPKTNNFFTHIQNINTQL